MELFRTHEIFEIDVLERLKNKKFLEPLVFGGGTMLRLCHDLPRYSADLDFWFLKETNVDKYFNNLNNFLTDSYTLTDTQIKQNTLLFEIKSKDYPRKLKIEIRKVVKRWDYQERIAYSKFSTKQVIVKAHSLEQTMINKVEAILVRKEIRDGFDIEFLLRRGVNLSELTPQKRMQMRKIIEGFSANDFKVTLGSVLEADIREYYIKNRFSILLERLSQSAF
jgi:predicted nucleotidyltransferase component of viral defense system